MSERLRWAIARLLDRLPGTCWADLVSWAQQPKAVDRPLWKDLPSWFLVAEEDRMIAPETQRFMATRMKARVRSHQVDHTPIVTAPGVVVEIIRDAVRDAITRQTPQS